MNKIMPSKKSELRRILDEIGMNIKTLWMELPTTMMTHNFFSFETNHSLPLSYNNYGPNAFTEYQCEQIPGWGPHAIAQAGLGKGYGPAWWRIQGARKKKEKEWLLLTDLQ